MAPANSRGAGAVAETVESRTRLLSEIHVSFTYQSIHLIGAKRHLLDE
jgi:hypothetical protein